MIRFALVFALCACAAEAQSVKLQGNEINILLSGNTVLGVWDGIAYRQCFDADVTTIYPKEGARAARGGWHAEGEEYQSRWPEDTTWEGWFVMEHEGLWCRGSKATPPPPTPFDMIEGRELVAQ